MAKKKGLCYNVSKKKDYGEQQPAKRLFVRTEEPSGVCSEGLRESAVRVVSA